MAQYLGNTITDGDFTVPYAVSEPRFSQPFDGDNGEYVLEQDFWIDAEYFSPLPLNTPHDTGPYVYPNPYSLAPSPQTSYPNYVLVKESPTEKVGNGIVQWTRTYAMLPNNRNDYATMAYLFIGFLGALTPTTYAGNPTIPPGRPQFTKVVLCRVQNDYFITLNTQPPQQASTVPPASPTSTFLSQPITSILNPVTYQLIELLDDPSDITIIPKQAYYLGQGSWTGTDNAWVPLYSDPVQAQIHGLPLGAIWDIAGNLASTGVGVAPVPTRTQYNTWITNGTEIVAEDSSVARWMGNIYVRQTKYVVAI